jgi:molybdopterin molybdotransferase
MLSVSEARERILANFKPLGAITIPISQAAGRILAENILADIDLPPFDNSSVDGFAVLTADIQGATRSSPRDLRVVADIHAGDFYATSLQRGETARIMTGAAIPPQTDAVVMVEDTDFNDRSTGSSAPKTVSVFTDLQCGKNIRHHGDDLHIGDKVLDKGISLRAQEIGLLAMLGKANIPVSERPRVALLSSGDELLPVEMPLTPGKIHDANSYALSALAEGCGAKLFQLGVAADNEADIRSRMQRAITEKVDMIITSAGVSVGAFDYIRSIVEADGALDFWKVDMRPGKPLAYGNYHGTPFFGLPGNPVSAFIGFHIFIRPALEKLSGLVPKPKLRQKARLRETVESDGRESYFRGVVTEENGHLVAQLTGHQGSGNIFSLVQANALLIVPSGVKSLPANSEIDIWLIE